MPSIQFAYRATAISVLAVACLLLVAPVMAQSGSSSLVISQAFGGGGNTTSIYLNDYVEIFNRGTAPVSLSGKSLQYASASGTGNFGASSSQITVLPNVTLAPGQYYLVQEAGGSVGSPLPVAADLVVSSNPISMSATAGKVALVNSTTSLGCNGGSNPCSSSALALIIDLVGYGGANFYEGRGPAPTLSVTIAALRAGDGCTDSDNNASDFSATAPAPRNSSSPTKPCGGGTPTSPTATGSANPSSVAIGEATILTVSVTPGANPTSSGIAVTADLSAIGGSATQSFSDNGDGTFSYSAAVSSGTSTGPKTILVAVSDAQARTASTSISLTVTAPVPHLAIHDIQGVTTSSPYTGQLVQTEGIVTGVKTNGFFIQAPDDDADADPNTSEGVFVYTGSTPPTAAMVGNQISLRGTVQDFVPASDPLSPPFTEISNSPTVTLISTGNPLPTPVTLMSADLNPAGSSTQLSKYESMRVHVETLNVISPTGGALNEANATSISNGIFFGVLPGTPRPFREPGIEAPDVAPIGIPQFDGNPERLRVNSIGQVGATAINVSTGAVVSNLTGPLDLGFRAYTIDLDPGTPPAISKNDAHAVPVRVGAGEGEITVASFNLERFYDTVKDNGTSDLALTAAAFDKRLSKASLAIRNVLQAPDILGVAEMEHLSTLQALADKIDNDAVAAGQTAPGYQPYLFEGNDVGGIDVGLLVKNSRIEVLSVDQVGKDTTFVQPDASTAILNDRPPLVLKAIVIPQGKEVVFPLTVIVNHLRSLLGMDGADGPRIRAKRLAQAEFLANLVNEHQLNGELVVSVGDYNAYDVNDGYVDIINTVRGGTPHPLEDVLGEPAQWVAAPMIDLAPADPTQHYSYVYDGNAQVLDHIIVSQGLTVNDFMYARNGADLPESLRGDASRPERISDHDAPVAYFAVPRDTVAPVVTLTGVTEGSTYLLGTVPAASCSTTDAMSGVAAAATLSVTGGNVNGTGQLTASCSGAVDKVGNTAAAVSVHYTVVAYVFGGFGPPLGSGVAVKSGSTVPVKFQLRDWAGNLVTSTSAISGIHFVPNASCGGDPVGEWADTTSTGDTALRFDTTGNQFIYNWKTTGLSAGCYTIGVTTADTLVHAVPITIK